MNRHDFSYVCVLTTLLISSRSVVNLAALESSMGLADAPNTARCLHPHLEHAQLGTSVAPSNLPLRGKKAPSVRVSCRLRRSPLRPEWASAVVDAQRNAGSGLVGLRWRDYRCHRLRSKERGILWAEWHLSPGTLDGNPGVCR